VAGSLRQADHVVVNRQVGYERLDPVAELGPKRLERILAPTRGDDGRAAGVQGTSDRATETASGAGEEDATAIER
jgi:hypothetical protein